jgi:protein SCO1/2
MSRKVMGYIIFFVVLTGAFFYFVFRGTDNWKAKLPTVSYVKPFYFTNQDGKMVDEDDLKGRVTVVEYFFTTCKGICPKMNGSLRKFMSNIKMNRTFLILAHTVQPEIDSVPRPEILC